MQSRVLRSSAAAGEKACVTQRALHAQLSHGDDKFSPWLESSRRRQLSGCLAPRAPRPPRRVPDARVHVVSLPVRVPLGQVSARLTRRLGSPPTAQEGREEGREISRGARRRPMPLQPRARRSKASFDRSGSRSRARASGRRELRLEVLHVPAAGPAAPGFTRRD
ncbi:hypothetical protein EYF80_053306 [Liparis tanakae]|uniref:Uncharacterized protein n=1 Tax=Liparis tanakae TaxID=230148 RepID=A0A4Z2F5W9_9TELE|nr:hypothetical protein EYF80_053306 [Liparis tanakae]